MLKSAVLLRLLATAIVAVLAILLFFVDRATANSGTGRTCAVPPVAAAPKIEEPIVAEPEPIAPPPIVKLGREVVGTTLTMEVSGYTSEEGQTDKHPCEAADQSNICERKAANELICASNRFPLGTKLDIDGLGPCVVADRTSKKYSHRIDWYFGHDAKGSTVKKQRALKIGVRARKVRVISIPE